MLDGATTECTEEPLFPEIWKQCPTVDSPREQIRASEEYIASLKDLRCQKLMASATSCHGCEFNPHFGTSKSGVPRSEQAELLTAYNGDLAHMWRLYDAVKMKLLTIHELDSDEFDRLRILWHAIEKKRNSPSEED